MKHLTLIFFSAFYLTSCSNGKVEEKGPATMMRETAKAVALAADVTDTDPVCEMSRDSSWTDHAIYNKDTIWFCSEGCKKAFEARPGKYIK